MKSILIGIVFVLFISGCQNNCKECGCDNIDDCLSKYKFEEARKYESHNADYEKSKRMFMIISSEMNYWISQKDFDRAAQAVQEIPALETGIVAGLDENKKNKKYYEFMFSIVRGYCELGNIEGAEKFLLQLPEETSTITEEYISYGSANANENQIEKCRKKYEAVKKGLKQNQDIEPFKESESDHYKITTYEFPRKEGIKIIEECKKTRN